MFKVPDSYASDLDSIPGQVSHFLVIFACSIRLIRQELWKNSSVTFFLFSRVMWSYVCFMVQHAAVEDAYFLAAFVSTQLIEEPTKLSYCQ